jgi:hypothetical protein
MTNDKANRLIEVRQDADSVELTTAFAEYLADLDVPHAVTHGSDRGVADVAMMEELAAIARGEWIEADLEIDDWLIA